MKITTIELHTANVDDPLILSFRDPSRSNPFNIRDCDGLDADQIISRFSGVTSSTQKYFDFALLDRILVMQIQLNPRPAMNESFSSLRDKIYRMISSSRTGLVEIKLKNEGVVVAELHGSFNKVETVLFQKLQEVKLTIDCNEPMLLAPDITTVDTSAFDVADFTVVDEVSTAPHGFTMRIKFNEFTGDIVVAENILDGWIFGIYSDTGFLIDDELLIQSETNNKALFLYRGFDVINWADKIIPDSAWPMMFPGENPFQITAAVGGDISVELLHYRSTFWGV